jgi:iron(III) transport system substrate-binding protein
MFRRLCGAAVLAGGAAIVMAAQASAQTELTVYTAVEAEDLKRYAEAFNKDNPDIEIKWVRDSTGIVTAKLLAEKNNPQADVIWGLAATSLLLMKGEGMLEPYAPAGLDKLDPKVRDKEVVPYWVGMDAWVAAICFYPVEGEA